MKYKIAISRNDLSHSYPLNMILPQLSRVA